MNQLLSPRIQLRRPPCQVSMTSGRTGAHRRGQSTEGCDGRPPWRRGAPRCPFHWGRARAVVEGMARHQALQGDQEGHSLKTEEIQTTHRYEFLGSFVQFHVTLGKLAGGGGELEGGHTDCKKRVRSKREGSPALNKQDCHPDRSSRAEVRKRLAREHLPHGDLPQLLPEALRACPRGFLKRGGTTQHSPLTRLTLHDESCWSSPHCLDLTVGV